MSDVPEGHIGAAYGYQWRYSGADFPSTKNGIDQLRYLLTELTMNPHGRRAVLNAWNPKQLHLMALPPCHMTYQFYIGAGGLSCQMMMRSCDVGAGLPFNIASTALFTHLMANVLHVEAHRIIVIMGDTHIYEEHFESAHQQIERVPYEPPSLVIKKAPPPKEADITEKLHWLETLTMEDVEMYNYIYHPPLKYAMVV